MGVDYVSKALLLDEAEHCSRQGAPLDALAADALGRTLGPLEDELADRGLTRSRSSPNAMTRPSC